MRRRRKTQAERDEERRLAKARAWETFRPRLEAISSYKEARELVAYPDPPDTPGRGHYTNLIFFLDTFAPPGGATAAELAIYVQLIRRFDERGELKPGVAQSVEAALERAMSEPRW